MALGHANRVGPALQFTATVYALSGFFARVKTYFRLFAFRVVRTLPMGFAARFKTVRVTGQPRGAHALAEHARGSNTAFDVFTLVFTFSIFTRKSVKNIRHFNTNLFMYV